MEPAIDAPGADDLVPVDETSDIPEESASKPPFSWEEFIGTKLLSYIGIGILVLGLVSLLTYSITLMGEWGRALIGAGCGSALLVAGFFVEPKIRYQLFGRILMGGMRVNIFRAVARPAGRWPKAAVMNVMTSFH